MSHTNTVEERVVEHSALKKFTKVLPGIDMALHKLVDDKDDCTSVEFSFVDKKGTVHVYKINSSQDRYRKELKVINLSSERLGFIKVDGKVSVHENDHLFVQFSPYQFYGGIDDRHFDSWLRAVKRFPSFRCDHNTEVRFFIDPVRKSFIDVSNEKLHYVLSPKRIYEGNSNLIRLALEEIPSHYKRKNLSDDVGLLEIVGYSN